MSCAGVRDRLPELVLGVLPEDERRDLERHLRSCSGCRKERAELDDGAATVGLSLPPEDPPEHLEHRVVERVALAAGRRVPAQAHRRLHTRVRRLATVALAAALLALLSVGWAFSERQHAGVVAKVSQARAQQVVDRFARLVNGLGQTPVEARLVPSSGYQGTGTATIVSMPKRDDLILVVVYLVHGTQGPYTVRLQTRSGKVFTAGQLATTTSGTLVFNDSSGSNLAQVQFVSILDRHAQPVMSGVVRPYAASPGP